jgi:hypothetical protein
MIRRAAADGISRTLDGNNLIQENNNGRNGMGGQYRRSVGAATT